MESEPQYQMPECFEGRNFLIAVFFLSKFFILVNQMGLILKEFSQNSQSRTALTQWSENPIMFFRQMLLIKVNDER